MAILIRRLVDGDDPRISDFHSYGVFLPPEATYRNSITAILNEIRMTLAGKLVLEYLENANHNVVIVPDTFSFPVAAALDGQSASTTSFDERGSGSKVIIYFSPNSVSALRHPQLMPEPHDVLLHELCHALRSVTGTINIIRGMNNSIRLIPIVSFHDLEEFFAVIVTNVHCSQLGRPLRGNHGSWRLRNPEVMRVPPYSTRLRQFCQQMPEFTRGLSVIPQRIAPFNPFRDIYSRTFNRIRAF